MNRITTTVMLCILLLLQFGLAGTANAGLVDKTEAGLPGGAANLTLDEATDRYWLDLGVTYTVSFADVYTALQPTSLLPGFQIATALDVKGLFTAMGFLTTTPFSGITQTVGIASEWSDAVHHLHDTDTDALSGVALAGMIYQPDINASYATVAAATYDSNAGGTVTTHAQFTQNKADTEPLVGTWIFRQGAAESVVPEPSTFTMMAFCGIAMAGYSRLRRRRK